MNGFEILRRRIIDYTSAGQWSQVYDGLIEECDEYRLKAENAKLRELVRDMLRNMHGCTFHHSCGSCDFDECIYEARARELGIEVE